MGQNIGVVVLNAGGAFSKENLAAVGQVGPVGVRRLRKIVVQTAPSAGALTLNDCVHGGAAAGNQIFNRAFGDIKAGDVYAVDWPCALGIDLTAVGTGGVYAVSYD